MRTALAFPEDPYEHLRGDIAMVRAQLNALIGALRAEDVVES
ncbi:hypothetical protein [Streptosporangium vulgare]|uniref:Uncharacterized protein n=1 Tax=Streptosporangium vulgare TaxID=46190 RepID=A0ABV5TPZ8_9ACTN